MWNTRLICCQIESGRKLYLMWVCEWVSTCVRTHVAYVEAHRLQQYIRKVFTNIRNILCTCIKLPLIWRTLALTLESYFQSWKGIIYDKIAVPVNGKVASADLHWIWESCMNGSVWSENKTHEMVTPQAKGISKRTVSTQTEVRHKHAGAQTSGYGKCWSLSLQIA